MKPPKCKSCGKEEWRHVCGFVAFKATAQNAGAPTLRKGKVLELKRPDGSSLKAGDLKAGETVTVDMTSGITTKPTRKEYLKLKARERRARERAEKAKILAGFAAER